MNSIGHCAATIQLTLQIYESLINSCAIIHREAIPDPQNATLFLQGFQRSRSRVVGILIDMHRLDNLTLLARIDPPTQFLFLDHETPTTVITLNITTITLNTGGHFAQLQIPLAGLRCLQLLAIPPLSIFIATGGDPLFTAGGNVPINIIFASPGGRNTHTATVGA